jgi:hypothetical protein
LEYKKAGLQRLSAVIKKACPEHRVLSMNKNGTEKTCPENCVEKM